MKTKFYNKQIYITINATKFGKPKQDVGYVICLTGTLRGNAARDNTHVQQREHIVLSQTVRICE